MHEVHLIVRNALNLAVERGLLDKNVALAVHSPKRRSGATTVARVWNAAEVAEFLDAAASQRLLQCLGGRPVEFGAKTRSSRRPVELDAETLLILQRWRRRLQDEGLPHGPDDWMFCNTAGRFLNPQSISQIFCRVVERSGLPRIRFHDLRHTRASLLIANDVPVKVVTERLGHAHPAFTIHTFQHLLPSMSSAAATHFAGLVSAAGR